MASLAALLRTCMETLKSILTSQDFGSEYEILCTQLSIQELRVKLWGDSFGLHITCGTPVDDIIFDQPEVQATVIRTIDTIVYLLTEVEILRWKYEVRPRLLPTPENQDDDLKRPESTLHKPSIFALKTGSPLRQRVRDNQKQKSFLSITKWAVRDAKRFGEQVNQLKHLIDGLEEVSRAANLIRPPQPLPINSPEENPPPYSEVEQRRRTLALPRIPSPATSVSTYGDTTLALHHHAFDIYLTRLPASPELPRSQPREKLVRLRDIQLKELRIDVYDDLIRRQHGPSTIHCLPKVSHYHPKRNEARQKLSTLLPHRFRHLVADLVAELEHRFPYLQNIPARASTLPSYPLGSPTLDAARRYGRLVQNAPPLPLSSRPLHRRTLSDGNPAITTTKNSATTTQTGNHTLPTHPPTSTFSSRSHISTQSSLSTAYVEVFKSFRVSMDDPCSKVLPAALKKYGIMAPIENYELFLVYGDKERCLTADEKPLRLFKALQAEGVNPLFMLRKVHCE